MSADGRASAAREDDAPVGRRRLVVLAASAYSDEPADFRDRIDRQVRTVTEWFGSASGPSASDTEGPGPGARTPDAPVSEAQTPYTEVFRHDLRDLPGYRAFLDGGALKGLEPEDALVLYLTGHGRALPSLRHCIELPDGDSGRSSGRILTSEVVESALDSGAEQILVLVDTCYAGALKRDLWLIQADLALRPTDGASPVVIGSSDFTRTTLVGAFTRLLADVHDSLRHGGPRDSRYLSPAQFLSELRTRARSIGTATIDPVQMLPDAIVLSDTPSLCLPNPGYRPTVPLVSPARHDLVAGAGGVHAHWTAKASGRAGDDDPGWYFSGRASLLHDLAGWLADGQGVLVVAGEAGSGKSALLALAVLLSDPLFTGNPAHRDRVAALPPGSRPHAHAVDAAVLARGKDADGVASALAAALGHDGDPEPDDAASGVDDLVHQVERRLAARSEPLTLVVDGVDEALEPARVVSEVFTRLCRLTTSHGQRAVRLVLGLRRPRGNDGNDGHGTPLAPLHGVVSGASWTTLRTDGPETADDVASYVAALLAGPDPATGTSPYLADERAAETVARVIAAEVSPSFLDARLVARRLRAGAAVQDQDDPVWRRGLRLGTEHLLTDDLADVARQTGLPVTRLRAVLRATAFALGTGLPAGEPWRATAFALATEPDAERGGGPGPDRELLADPALIDKAVDHVLTGRLAGYLVAGTEDGRQVHRPAHERLTELLRGSETERTAAERAVAGALCALVRDWDQDAPPHPYLGRHLARHARRGGILDDEHVPATFLLWESSGTVRSLLGMPAPDAAGSRRLAAWSRMEPYFTQADLPPGPARASSLVFSCAGLGVAAGVRSGALAGRWSRWANPVNLLAATGWSVEALCELRQPDGTRLIAAAGAGSEVRFWDAGTGEPYGVPLTDHEGTVSELLAISRTDARHGDGGDLLASAGQDGAVRVRHPFQGVLLAEVETGDTLLALSAVERPERRLPLLVTGGKQGVVQLWDPEADPAARLVGTLPTRAPAPPAPAPPVPQDGERSGGRLRAVVRKLGELPKVRSADDVRKAVRELRLEGFPATAGTPPERSPVSASAPVPASGATPVAVYRLLTLRLPSGPPLLAGAGEDGTVWIWDLAAGTLRHTLTGHKDAVFSLAQITTGTGRHLLASASRDGAVRLWDPLNGTEAAEPYRGPGKFYALATVPRPGGGHLLAVGDNLHEITLLDPDTMAPTEPALAGHRNSVRATCALRDAEGPALATADAAGDIRVWRLTGDAPPGGRPDRLGVNPFPVAYLPTGDGGPEGGLLATANDEDRVRLWDADSGEPVGEIPLNASQLTAVPDASADGPALLAFGSAGLIVLCDPASREPLATTAEAEGRTEALCVLPGGPSGTLLAAGRASGTLRTYAVPGLAPATDAWQAHDTVRALTTVRAGGDTLLASAGAGGAVRVWDPLTGQLVREIEQTGLEAWPALTTVPAPGGGDWLVSADRGDSIRFWDPLTGSEVGESLRQPGGVRALCPVPLPDGRTLLASGGDLRENLCLWDPVTRRPVDTVVAAGLLVGLAVRPGTAERPPWLFVSGRGLACFRVTGY
ncbi:nSTAND1 domain-containing NTPase [Streptomyces sp. enrichment culture]|uniref:nSTAND1 domain-containing NTPase n=1 Tax=Streptomyces sp. enrichment culture TaxID=1795815 RepID=UPI003F571778